MMCPNPRFASAINGFGIWSPPRPVARTRRRFTTTAPSAARVSWLNSPPESSSAPRPGRHGRRPHSPRVGLAHDNGPAADNTPHRRPGAHVKDRRHLRVVTDLEARPDLRHVRRGDVVVYRVRVDIDDADPPIWRRIDLRSDITLDLLHQVLQVAFDWTDSHLHRFSLGGGGFDRHSQHFLCPYDVQDNDFDDDDGIPAADTRLDETLSATGDVLHYLYDYGDNWELTIRLEQVLPAD